MYLTSFSYLLCLQTLKTICSLCSLLSLFATFFFITRVTQGQRTTVYASIFPLAGILLGSTATWLHGIANALCGLFCVCFGLALLAPRFQRTIIYASFLTSALQSSLLFLCVVHHKAAKDVLACAPHALHGYIVDIQPWLTRPGGKVVTMHITHVDHQNISFALRYYLTAPQRYEIGDLYYLSRVHLKKENAPQETRLEQSLAREGIVATFFMPQLYGRRLHDKSFVYAFQRFWHTRRAALYTKLQKACNSPQLFALFSALFLGNKNNEHYPKIKTSFSAWGITHYLARSGLHIVILIALWSYLLGYVYAPLFIKVWALLIMLFVYTMLSWSSLSFYRALFFFMLYSTGILLKKIPNPLHLFCILTTLTLITSPLALFFLDFQLSFGLTFVLLLLSHVRKTASH